MANAQRCKLFYTLLHSCTRNSLWCQSSSSTETPDEKQLAVNWLHVRSHTYIIYLVDSPDEYSGAVLYFSCVLAYNFCRLEQASVFRATVFALVSGPNDRPFLSLMIAGHGGHGVPRNTERYSSNLQHIHSDVAHICKTSAPVQKTRANLLTSLTFARRRLANTPTISGKVVACRLGVGVSRFLSVKAVQTSLARLGQRTP